MKVTRIFDLLDNLKEKYRKQDILCGRVNGEWRKYSVDEYIDEQFLIYHFYFLINSGTK